MTEPWPHQLPSGVSIEEAQARWPRDPLFRPDKLTLARHARRLSMRQLAIVSGVNAKRISRLERNLKTPTENDMVCLSDALRFPIGFFAQDDPVIAVRMCGEKGTNSIGGDDD